MSDRKKATKNEKILKIEGRLSSYKGLQIIKEEKIAIENLYTLIRSKKKYTKIIIENEHVTELNLMSQELADLPESIDKLEKLRKLDLRWNKLKTLPESFGNLKSLQELLLESNDLETLPDSFVNLGKLEELDLRCNNFITLPTTFKNLKNLKNLILGEYMAKKSEIKKITDHLVAQGCKVHIEARVWVGGPGGDWETKLLSYYKFFRFDW